jgi:hypothetical protein
MIGVVTYTLIINIKGVLYILKRNSKRNSFLFTGSRNENPILHYQNTCKYEGFTFKERWIL